MVLNTKNKNYVRALISIAFASYVFLDPVIGMAHPITLNSFLISRASQES